MVALSRTSQNPFLTGRVLSWENQNACFGKLWLLFLSRIPEPFTIDELRPPPLHVQKNALLRDLFTNMLSSYLILQSVSYACLRVRGLVHINRDEDSIFSFVQSKCETNSRVANL